MKSPTHWLLLLALPLLLGCPPAEDPAHTSATPQLILSTMGEQPASIAVGNHVDLQLGYGPGTDSTLFGAMISNSQQLTEWHVDPVGSAEVDSVTNRATFKSAGLVKLWATYTTPDGVEARSNDLEISVAGDSAAGAEAPAIAPSPAASASE